MAAAGEEECAVRTDDIDGAPDDGADACPIAERDAPESVDQEGEGESEFGGESCMAAGGGRIHAVDHGAGGFELRPEVAKLAELAGSTRRVVGGVEDKNHGAAAQL